MTDFRKQLAAINAAADHSPGFVWRFETDAGDATGVRIWDDPSVLFNMSVWESIDDLKFYVYRGAHAGPFRERKKWFTKMEPSVVLWWVPAGTLPSVEEGTGKLEQLREHGPSRTAFTFQRTFPPPE